MRLQPLVSEAAARLRTAGIERPFWEARLLLAWAAEARMEDVIGERVAVSETLQTRFWELVARRGGREPMAYIAGRKEFWSLPFAVGPGVLVPRPETETLVECALEFFSDNDAPMRILDCGTGSGCLLLAILHERPNARGIGIDRSADALAYARRNARDLKLDGRCELIQGSWSDAPSEPFDLIVSNPPYIVATAISALEPELGFEPREALAAGESGLDAYRNLAPVVRARLAPGGRACIELGAGQAAAVYELLTGAGLRPVETVPDFAGIPRCIVVE